jgi:hypothetical protein
MGGNQPPGGGSASGAGGRAMFLVGDPVLVRNLIQPSFRSFRGATTTATLDLQPGRDLLDRPRTLPSASDSRGRGRFGRTLTAPALRPAGMVTLADGNGAPVRHAGAAPLSRLETIQPSFRSLSARLGRTCLGGAAGDRHARLPARPRPSRHTWRERSGLPLTQGAEAGSGPML